MTGSSIVFLSKAFHRGAANEDASVWATSLSVELASERGQKVWGQVCCIHSSFLVDSRMLLGIVIALVGAQTIPSSVLSGAVVRVYI